MLYLSDAYSVSMLSEGVGAVVLPRSLDWVKCELGLPDQMPEMVPGVRSTIVVKIRTNFKSVVGHEDSAKWLSLFLDTNIEYNRESIQLLPGDRLIAIVPQFRAENAREFSKEELLAAHWRYFEVQACEDPCAEIMSLYDGR